MTEFTKGQRVHVEFDGTVENYPLGTGVYVRRISLGTGVYVRGDDGVLNLSITLTDPPGWPVQAGDIWRRGDSEWFVTRGESGLRLVADDRTLWRQIRPEELLEGPSAPVLIRRRDEKE